MEKELKNQQTKMKEVYLLQREIDLLRYNRNCAIIGIMTILNLELNHNQ